MNISNYEKFSSKIFFYQILYIFLIMSITFIGIIELFYFKNIIKVDFQGIVLKNNILEISNLRLEDVNLILESKEVIVKDQEIKKEIIDIKEMDSNYLVKIKLDNVYIENSELKITCILKEESLYQFIFNTMKGDI